MYNNSDFSKNDRSDRNGHHGNRNSSNNNEPIDLNITKGDGKVIPFKKEWITIEADEDLVTYAEAAGKRMSESTGKLTTSKIRSIFGEIKRIEVSGFEKEKPAFYLLRPKVAYAVGREKKSANGYLKKVEGILVFQDIFEKAAAWVTDAKSYHNFCNLMEALVAYRKANGDE